MRNFLNAKYLAVPLALAALLTLGLVRPASAQLDLNIGGGLLNLGIGSPWGAPAVNTYPAVIDNGLAPVDDFYGVNTYPSVIGPDFDYDLF